MRMLIFVYLSQGWVLLNPAFFISGVVFYKAYLCCWLLSSKMTNLVLICVAMSFKLNFKIIFDEIC